MIDRSKYKYVFGIDCGVNTGIAVWGLSEKQLISVQTLMIHEAIEKVRTWQRVGIFVRVEDARKRKFFGVSGPEKWQGAGSIKRDTRIWEDFLTDFNIPFELVAPKNNRTKVKAEYFKSLTGWQERTSEHSRDAAMLVFGI